MSDELKHDHQEKLGKKFGAIFNGVTCDWANGLVRLNEYKALFDPAHIKFINTFSGPFMGDVQQLFWRDLVLYITRLTDPVDSGKGKKNITVLALPDCCDDLELRDRVEKSAKTAVSNAQFARAWRDKRISHSDLNLAIDPDAEPLDPVTLASAQSVLDAVHAALDAISYALMKSHISNRVTLSEPWAMAFCNYSQMLVTAVRYVDSLIEPAGSAPSDGIDVETNFLAKVVDREPTMDEILQIIYLRKAARRFS